MSKAESWGPASHTLSTPARSERFSPGRFRRPLTVLGAFLLVLGLAAAGLAYYSSRFDGKIYPGVRAMGVDLSGKTPAKARQALLAVTARYADAPLTVRQAQKSWRVTPAALGLRLDVDPVVRLAFEQGRSGSALADWGQRLPLVGSGAEIRPRYVLDQNRTQTFATGLVDQVYRAPVDARVRLAPDGSFIATPDRAGQRLDPEAATAQLREIVGRLGTDEITLPVRAIAANQTRDEWRNPRALAPLLGADPVTLRLDAREWTLPAGLLASALEPVREGDIVARLNPGKLGTLLAPVLRDVARKPVDAALTIREARPLLTPERPGERLIVGETVRRIQAALVRDRTVELATAPVPAALTAQDLRPTALRLDRMLLEPLILRHGEETWSMRPERFVRWLALSVDAPSRSAAVSLDERQIDAYLSAFADDVREEPVDATLAIEDAEPVLTPETLGARLDLAGSRRELIAALEGGHTASLATTPIPVRLTAKDLEPHRKRLATLLGSPLALKLGENKWTVSTETLAEWTTLEVLPEERTATIELDQEEIAALFSEDVEDGIWESVYKAPVEGELTWRDDKVAVTEHSKDGRELDTRKMIALFNKHAFSSARSVTIPVTASRPLTPTDDLAALGITRQIAVGRSVFTGSVPERTHNVRTAARYLHDTVVAPGEEFKFLQAIGDIGLATGYRRSKILQGEETVPGIGGGVCQVSTTMFRAAFWGGLPITERNQHSSIVTYYTLDDSPDGFDAAVFEPNQNLKFVNDTGKHILIRTAVVDEKLTVTIYGTPTGRKVERSVRVWERTPALPRSTKIDPELRPGQSEQVSYARPGVQVTIWRIIRKDGEVVKEDSFYSNYGARGNVWKVGPSRRAPRPSPAPVELERES